MRMGLHVHSTEHTDLLKKYVSSVQPPVVKLFAQGLDDELAAWLTDHGVTVVGRIDFGNDGQPLSGNKAGRKVKQLIKDIQGFDHIPVWEFYNETSIEGMEDHQRYNSASINFMNQMNDIGRKGALFSFSTGTPEMSEWDAYKDALVQAGQQGHWVALHEYSAPVMQWMTGDNRVLDLTAVPATFKLDDPCLRPDIVGDVTLRYRSVVAKWRAMGVDPLPSIVITECGIDDVHPRPGPAVKGWRDYVTTEWGNHPLFGDYAQQWLWYCAQLTTDPVIAGVVDFGFATLDPAWGSFDLTQTPEMFQRMIAVMKSLPKGHAPWSDVGPLVQAGLGNAATEPVVVPPPDIAPAAATDTVVPMIKVLAGNGWLTLLERAGLPKNDEWLARIRAANPLVDGLTANQWVQVPGYRAVKD